MSADTSAAVAEESRVETPRTYDEETPLLSDDHASDAPSDIKKERGKTVGWYLWRGFWVIVAALVLAFFIKGWVDAGGDVDVRHVHSLCANMSYG
jgi:hypothetical protein